MKNLPMIAIASLFVAACGGGGGGGSGMPPVANAPGSEVPLSATQDSGAAYSFVASVAAAKSESSDPLVVGEVTLATSETDEPQPL